MYNKNTNIGFDIDWNKLDPEDPLLKLNSVVFDKLKGSDNHKLIIINGLPIRFDPISKVIGLNFSGGADSTLLFFLLCTIIKELNVDVKIVASTLVRFWEERSWTDDLATNIFHWMKRRFPDIEMIHELGFIPPALECTPLKNIKLDNPKFSDEVMENSFADVYAVRSFSDYLAYKHKILVTYSGTTMNPEHLTEEIKAPAFRKKRPIQDDDLKVYFSIFPVNDPFRVIEKTWVMAQYENFEIMDLLLMTRSCGAGADDLDRKYGRFNWTVTGSRYSCGFCFFCVERQWATDNKNVYLKGYHCE